jgi:hypothetical protein
MSGGLCVPWPEKVKHEHVVVSGFDTWVELGSKLGLHGFDAGLIG